MRLDLLHVWRAIRRAPASALAAVLTLALTLGVGAAILALVNALILRPPPFADPDSLFTVQQVAADDPTASPRAVDYGIFAAWRARAAALAGLEAADDTNVTITGLGAAERTGARTVTPGFLALLGVSPILGRSFEPGDVGQPVVIVSHAFWRGKLSGDPSVIGRQLTIGGRGHTIVGVLPQRFAFGLDNRPLWRPMPLTEAQASRVGFRVAVLARLRDGGSAAELARTLNEIAPAAGPRLQVTTTPVRRALAGDVPALLGPLAAAAALVVLVAFANLAGLVVVRAIDRARELAVRRALGGRPLDVVRPLLLEAWLLVALGTAGGVLLAAWLTPAVANLALERFGSVEARDITIGWPVIAAVAALAAICASLCGAVAAWLAARAVPAGALRQGTSPAPRERKLRQAFVAAQVAAAVVLLLSLTVVGRSLHTLMNLSPGFEPRGVLTLQLSLPAVTYDSDGVARFYSALQDALVQRLGDVVSLVDELPLTGSGGRTLVSLRRGEPGREALVRTAAEGYFDVMRIPLESGRAFDRRDGSQAPPRVVISRALAGALFPSTEAIGRQVLLQASNQVADVIGVAGDVKHRALDEAVLPTVYTSALQAPSPSSVVVTRSPRPEGDVASVVREEVARLDPDLPVYGIASMTQRIARSPGIPERRVLSVAFGGFAALAVLLAALGLFGVAAHDVASRRTELALRIALGAGPGRIVAATMRRAGTTVGAGLGVGALLSVWVTRALGNVGSGGGLDAAGTTLPAVVLLAAALCAVLPVARRAARIDPIRALRGD